jgi:hypothetical protein
MGLRRLLADVRHMRAVHPSSWLVAWSRVLTVRSVRVQRYLNMTPAERAIQYRWLYKKRRRPPRLHFWWNCVVV